jgi:hypothetical protein
MEIKKPQEQQFIFDNDCFVRKPDYPNSQLGAK